MTRLPGTRVLVGIGTDMAEALAGSAKGRVKADKSAINAIVARLEHGQVASRVVLDFRS